MSDIEKAARDAVEAQDNAQQVAMVLAVLQAQQITQQPPVPAPVQQPSGNAGKWIGIGIGGSFLAVSLALSAIAVAISAVALTCCLLILRSLFVDYQKGKG